MKWRFGMMDAARCISGVAGPSLQKIMTSTKGFSCSSTTTAVHQSLT
jgi:hypothetical protein